MADDARIEDLRRRLRKDPASIAFAQLAEELRRGGHFQDAVTVCRTGLAIYPKYLSARVTLGKALLELDRLDEAQHEFEKVHATAPDAIVAIRALADIRSRRDSTGTERGGHVEPPAEVAAAPPASQPASPRVDQEAALRIVRTVAALESWLAAIHVARAERRA